MLFTGWKMFKYGVFSGPYFPVFSPKTGKYGLEKTPYLDNFHRVIKKLGLRKARKIRPESNNNQKYKFTNATSLKLLGVSRDH